MAKKANYFTTGYISVFLASLLLALFGINYVFRTGTEHMNILVNNEMDYLSRQYLKEGSSSLNRMAEQMIRFTAEKAAFQAAAYMDKHPDLTLAQLQADSEFQSIAVQPVGKTGYTALHETVSLINRFHVNPAIVNTGLDELKAKLPDFWEIINASRGNKASGGYYKWLEADGSIRDKYMWVAVIPAKTGDNISLGVAATTYIDEFVEPSLNLAAKLKETSAFVSEAMHTSGSRIQNDTVILLILILLLFASSIVLMYLALLRSRNALLRQIEERKKAESALKESQQTLSYILNFLPDAAFVINKERKVIIWNKAIEELTGVKSEYMIGKGDYEYALPFYAERRPILIDLVLNPDQAIVGSYEGVMRREGILVGETYIKDFNAREAYLAGRACALYDSNGSLVGAIETIRDITDLRKSNEELKSAYQELGEAQSLLMQNEKMAAIGQLASGVAHEINNPLTGVLNNVQLIKMDLNKNPQMPVSDIKDLLDIIEDSGLRCTKITRSLLDFSHASTGEFRSVSINNICEKVITLIWNELRLSNISLHKEMPEGLPGCICDEQLMQQVVFNLISNALWAINKKPGKPGGEITVTTGFLGEQNLILLQIKDNGIGIKKHDLQKVFTPFYTTKTVGEGTGMGLSVVYGIVKKHGGKIEVESREGEGSAFKIYLPVKGGA